jgi:hypothetical protein
MSRGSRQPSALIRRPCTPPHPRGAAARSALLKAEEEHIKKMCEDICKFKPDLVVTEKGLSDLAAHYFTKAGISAIRRLRKTDNNRIARASGATIVHRTDEIREADVGTNAGLFEVTKIGDEFFAFVVDCKVRHRVTWPPGPGLLGSVDLLALSAGVARQLHGWDSARHSAALDLSHRSRLLPQNSYSQNFYCFREKNTVFSNRSSSIGGNVAS